MFLKHFLLFRSLRDLVLSKDFYTLMCPKEGKEELKLTWIRTCILSILFSFLFPSTTEVLKSLHCFTHLLVVIISVVLSCRISARQEQACQLVTNTGRVTEN